MIVQMDVENSTLTTELPPEVYTYHERIFVATVVVLVVICGSIGNTAVILAVAFSRKLQNSTYVFVTNLAICDLLTCLFLPWSAVALFSKDGWPLPRAELLCSAAAFMVFACVITSMFSLAAIAFNRYILVCHNFETFTKTFSTRNICIIVSISWMVPFSIVLALPAAGVGRLGYDEAGGGGCTDIDNSPGAKLYQWVQTFLCALPITAIIVCYSLIFIHVKRHFKKQQRTIKAQHMISIDPSISVDLDHERGPNLNTSSPATSTPHSTPRAPNHSASNHRAPNDNTSSHRAPNDNTSIHKAPNHNGSNHATPTPHSTPQAPNHRASNHRVPNHNGSKHHRKYSPNPRNATTVNVSSELSNESASELRSNGGVPDAYNTTNRRQRKLRRQQLQVTGRLFLIVCAYFICITPYSIAISIPGLPQRWLIYTSLLTIINSCINPAIYSATHPHFKEIFTSMLRCRFGDIPQPSDALRRFLNN